MYSRSHVLALAVLAGLVAGLARAEPPARSLRRPAAGRRRPAPRHGAAEKQRVADALHAGRPDPYHFGGRSVRQALERRGRCAPPDIHAAWPVLVSGRPVAGRVALRRRRRPGERGRLGRDLGKLVCKVPSGVCNFAAFSLDGATLVTAAWQNRLRFWDARTGAGTSVAGREISRCSNAVFSPDGSRFAWSEQGAVICMDVTTGKEAWRKEIRAAQVACSPGGVLAVRAWPNKGKNENVTENDPSEIRFLRIADGKPAGREPVPCSGQAVTLQYGPDGGALAWRDGQGNRDLRPQNGKERRTLPLAKVGWPGELFAFAPDGKTLTALVGRTLHRWDLSTGKDLYADVSGRGHNGPVVAVAWSPDGKRHRHHEPGFSGERVRLGRGHGQAAATLPASEERWFAWCYRLAFTPDGGRLLAAGGDNVIHCWDLSTGKEIWNGAALDAESKTADAPGSVPPHRRREAADHPQPWLTTGRGVRGRKSCGTPRRASVSRIPPC